MKTLKNQRFLVSQRRKSFRKLILLTIFVLFLANVSAQSLEINLISYDSELGNARIQVINNANTDFNDVKMKIDNAAGTNIVDTLPKDSSTSTFQTISPGSHDITITTKEGITLTKKLYFSPSQKQIQEQVQQQKQTLEQQKSQQPLTTKTQGISKYIYAILAIIAIVILYLLYKKLKKWENWFY